MHLLRYLVWLAACGALGLAGCGANQLPSSTTGGSGGYTPPAGTFTGPAFSGKVLAGDTPVQGAAVQIFAAGTTGNGSAAIQLLATALTTDTGGGFQVAAGSYSCPADTSILLIQSNGGHTGASPPNAAAMLVTVPGSCNSIPAGASFAVNELTTAASVYALRPFLAPGAQIGSTATNAAGMGLGVATLSNLVKLSDGTAPGAGFPAKGTAPVAKLNTVANLIHGCVASSGPQSAACSGFFGDTAVSGVTPQNTFDAALNVASHPGANVAALYALGSGSSVFSPALSAAPADWTLAIPFTGGGMNGPTSVSIDSKGDIWAASYNGVASLFTNTGSPVFPAGVTGYGLQESYGGAVDARDTMWIANEENNDASINNGFGSLTLLNGSGPALPGMPVYTSGGLDFPISVAFDRNDIAWVVDYGNAHVSLLNSSGVAQSGAAGYTSDQFAFPVAVAVDSKGNGWVANQSSSTVTRVAPDGSAFVSYTVGNGPSAVAVDSADNVWTANFFGDSVGLVSPGGAVLSGGGFTGGGLSRPGGIAADGAGTVWVANYRGPGISELAAASAGNPGAAISPSMGWGTDLNLLEAFGVAIDAAGNVWVSSYGDNRLVEFVGMATPVKTPLLGGVRVP